MLLWLITQIFVKRDNTDVIKDRSHECKSKMSREWQWSFWFAR